MSLFIPTYFSPIAQYIAIANATRTVFEVEDNFQKQTYRNRCNIFGPNGKQSLIIPIKHIVTTGRKKTKDILIDANFPWQSQHLKSIQTAYKGSPFFEFYEDDLRPIFIKKYRFLLDITLDTYFFLTDALEINNTYSKTTVYKKKYVKNDFRFLAEIKHQPEIVFDNYIQMFDTKHGFLPNLSILDLLFMEGPNTISYLEKKILF